MFGPAPTQALLGELQVLKVERDAAVAEVKAVKQTTFELEREKKVWGPVTRLVILGAKQIRTNTYKLT